MVSDGPSVIFTFWGLVEVVLTSLGLAQVIIYIQRMLVDTSLQDEYLDNVRGYTSFVKGVNLAYDWYNITAVLVFIMTVWVSVTVLTILIVNFVHLCNVLNAKSSFKNMT